MTTAKLTPAPRRSATHPPTPAPAGAAGLTRQLGRSAILASATAVFARQGIAATRVEDLLLAAGIARRTFYRYFTGKEDVLSALYDVSTGELIRAIEAAPATASRSPLAGIRLGIDTFIDFHRQLPRVLGELLELAMRADSQLAPRRRWMREQLVRLLDEAVVAVDGRHLDSFVYHALISALEGLSLHVLQHGAGEPELERARAVIHALVDQTLGLPHPTALPSRR